MEVFCHLLAPINAQGRYAKRHSADAAVHPFDIRSVCWTVSVTLSILYVRPLSVLFGPALDGQNQFYKPLMFVYLMPRVFPVEVEDVA